jgi:TrmH family RNA methyltransferase
VELVAQFQARGVPADMVAPEIFGAASDTTSPQGILGVLPLITIPLPTEADFILIADEIRDPGNLGTLMRSAAAAGADALIFTPGTVDPYSPKVTRAAMGAHFHLPLKSASWQEISDLTQGMQCLLADMNEGLSIWDANLVDPAAIILGGEARGAGKEARQMADQTIHIPMKAGTESLNAASAGAVLLFEVRRQRSARNK